MSKDIRSFLTSAGKSPVAQSKPAESPPLRSKKRSRRIIDSDEEDNELINAKSNKKKLKETEKSSATTKDSKKKEVEVKVENFFGNTPVLQKKPKLASPGRNDKKTNTEKPSKKSNSTRKKKEIENKKNQDPTFECDDELEASILQTDDDELLVLEDKGRCARESFQTPKKELKKSEKDAGSSKKDDKDVNTSNITNSDHKRKNAEAYQRYLHRSGPKNPGSKEIPEGTPTCLQGLTFVITGILDSLEREEAVDLIQKCGGRVTSQVSKKTNFVIVGDEPGESKIQKAEKCGTKKISEDDLLNLIAEKSENKSIKKNDSFIQGTPEKVSKYFNNEKKHKLPKDSDDEVKKTDVSQPKILKKEEEKTKSVLAETGSHSIKPISSVKSNITPPSSQNYKDEKKTVQKSPSAEDMLWVEKHKPKSTKAIVGQGGEKSNVKKLTYWLQNWHKNHSSKNEKKLVRPSPWSQSDDGSYFKAALLSGPPGVGKTTTIQLICQELGFDIIEFNASDTRSKRLLQEDVSELLSSKSLRSYVQDNGKSYTKQVLVMDEVDGMAGNEDRGGIQELIQLIKRTKIPIVGICNDRNHPKMRSLVNYCFDLRFQRPPVKQIKAAMMSVCFKENINMSGEALEELIVSSNHDLRQVLHRLSLLTFVDKTLSFEDAKKNGIDGKKPLNLSPWDVVRKIFSKSEQDNSSLPDKIDLFFQDYSLGPLFVQDSYLHVKPYKAKNSDSQTLALISKAADSIALGDIVERTIRNQNSWNLLPVQAIFSSVLPGHHMNGHFQGKIEFPVWLGKNSKMRKISRILQDLHDSLSTSISGDSSAINLDYLQSLKSSIIKPLIERGLDGVQESVKFMLQYNLIREDLDHIIELSSWPGMKDLFLNVDSKVKASFTRALNKESQRVSYATKRVTKASDDLPDNEVEEEDGSLEENDDLNSDPMIKRGKPKKTTKNEAGTSKGPSTKKESAKKRKGKEKN